ncbi:hypothetical protein [Myroides injenensis]|uniref:hypothetical protein n=1 Tax=Myroides injenensis TaxID=1183151 RepID=UPI000287B474|nr:hypothetical protein [Myroides injenensis]
MKIFKYFLFLILLGAISLIVFILTQNPYFKVERQFTVDAPKQIVYEYIEDLDTWQDWVITQKEDSGVYKINIEHLGEFLVRSEYNHPYDSLSQDILNDDKISNIYWKFTENKSNTTIDLKFEGTLDLKTKITSFFYGNPSKVASEALEKNTNTLIVYFLKQYKEYNLDPIGVKKTEYNNYISFPIESTIASLNTDINKSYKQIKDFCTANKVTITGIPFLILEEGITNENIKYQFALPIKEQLYLNEEDIYKVGAIEATNYYESSLKGFYSHLPESLEKTKTQLTKEDFTRDNNLPIIIDLEKSVIDSRFPAEWQTIIKIPIVKAPVIQETTRTQEPVIQPVEL